MGKFSSVEELPAPRALENRGFREPHPISPHSRTLPLHPGGLESPRTGPFRGRNRGPAFAKRWLGSASGAVGPRPSRRRWSSPTDRPGKRAVEPWAPSGGGVFLPTGEFLDSLPRVRVWRRSWASERWCFEIPHRGWKPLVTGCSPGMSGSRGRGRPGVAAGVRECTRGAPCVGPGPPRRGHRGPSGTTVAHMPMPRRERSPVGYGPLGFRPAISGRKGGADEAGALG